MRTPRDALALGLALLGAVFARPVSAAPAAAPVASAASAAPAASADSLDLFLRALADSTDSYFGAKSLDFDTTGLESLVVLAHTRPWRGQSRLVWRRSLILRFHRAEGLVLGGRIVVAGRLPGVLELGGSYGFANQGGRYEAGWRTTLWRGGPPPFERSRLARGRIGEGSRLDLEIRYARETSPFMPEHAAWVYGGVTAIFTGADRQSVYERRGVETQLTAWLGDWRLGGGFRHAREGPMGLATRFSLLGKRDRVVDVAPADPDRYSEAIGEIAFARWDWQLVGSLDGRDGGGDRWRLRAFLGKGLRLPGAWKAVAQLDAGACAARAPLQRRFDLGGPHALASLPYGADATDHMVLGRLDLIDGRDLLGMLGLKHPDFLVLHPGLFVAGGAAWNDPARRDVLFSRPPSAAWRGATGILLQYPLGIPDLDSWVQLLLAFPVGAHAGGTRLGLAARETFDLFGRP